MCFPHQITTSCASESTIRALGNLLLNDPFRISLLSRYSLLYSEESPVRLEKVSFDEKNISAGLKATRHIPAASPILSACGSMSANTLNREKAISAIEGPER